MDEEIYARTDFRSPLKDVSKNSAYYRGTPLPPENLPPPTSISFFKMEEDSGGCGGGDTGRGDEKKICDPDGMLNFSTCYPLMDFQNPSNKMIPTPNSQR